jgi:spore germination protein KA
MMKMFKKPKKIANKKDTSINNSKDNYSTKQLPQGHNSIFFTIDENYNYLISILGNSIGLVEGKYDILDAQVQIRLVYMESIADKKLISNQVIKPLLGGKVDFKPGFDDIPLLIQSRLISLTNVKKSNQMQQVVDSLLSGNTVIFINDIDTALIIGSRKIEKRTIEKPDNEVTVFASMDSFIEDLGVNCSLVMRRLPTQRLCFETFTIGLLSHTKVKLLWLDGIANTKLIEEARRRIKRINIDAIEGIGVLAELIEDKPLSVFPKYKQTQRPDVAAKYIADGHFAIFCSDSPFALIAPTTFWDHFKTMDDYSERVVISSLLRMVRYIAFILSITVSPMYLSFVTYNHTILPPALAVSISTGREGVPFPTVLELLIMTFAITIIREASLRIPGSVGYFIGALAAVIMGQSAVIAGYVSASVIIVVAISAISSFAIGTTSLVYPAKLINYLCIFLAGVFGMFGLINGIIIILWHMVSLESFGVPYLYPVIPLDLEGLKDTLIRAPVNVLKKRLSVPNSCIRINSTDNKQHKGE